MVRRPRLLRRFVAIVRADPSGVGAGFVALLLSSGGDLVAGLTLGAITGTLESLPGLLVLVPAAIGMRGNIFGGLGSIRGSYLGKIQITAKQPPESLTLAINGNGATGFLKATAQIRLAAKGDQTELSGEGEGTLGGIIAAVGSRLLEAAAKKMTTDFFTRLGAEITSRRAS